MKKILYRKFLSDCLIFFIISLVSTSVIIWVFQAVNYLDIVIDDGRDYSVYLKYAVLSFPKIVSKILPFAFFFSFSYVIANYELKNELLIYWNFGINKITFINFFLIFSLFLFFAQIILTALIVPKSQSLARSIIRTSNYNFVDNFIKVKKFNAAVNDLTIYTESKDKNKLIYIPLLLFVSTQLMLGTISYTVSFISFVFWLTFGLLFIAFNKENKNLR